MSEPAQLDFEAPTLRFFAPGIPAPGGSKRYVGKSKKTGRAILIDDAGERNTNWRAVVAYAARREVKDVMHGPLELTCMFVLPRKKSHYHTGKKAGQLRATAPQWHTVKPDTTKLLRSTEDALKGIAWDDDSQVALQHASKVYGEQTGCLITISPL